MFGRYRRSLCRLHGEGLNRQRLVMRHCMPIDAPSAKHQPCAHSHRHGHRRKQPRPGSRGGGAFPGRPADGRRRSGYNRLDFIRSDRNVDRRCRKRHRRIANDTIDGRRDRFNAARTDRAFIGSTDRRRAPQGRRCRSWIGRYIFVGDRLRVCRFRFARIDRNGFGMQRRFIRRTIAARRQPNAKRHAEHPTTTHDAQPKRGDLGQHAIGIVLRSHHRASTAKPAWL